MKNDPAFSYDETVQVQSACFSFLSVIAEVICFLSFLVFWCGGKKGGRRDLKCEINSAP